MAMIRSRILMNLTRTAQYMSRAAYSSDQVGELGSGAGKGGGGGGTIREAGGSFGRREAAEEERYFRKLQSEQLKSLKEHLDEEINFHQEQIKTHKDAINRHEQRITELHKKKEEHK